MKFYWSKIWSKSSDDFENGCLCIPMHCGARWLFNVPDVLVCKKCHIAILSIFFCFYVGKATMNKVKEREAAWVSSYVVRPYWRSYVVT